MDRPTRATRAILTTSATDFAAAAEDAIAAARAGGEQVSLLATAIDLNGSAAHSESGYSAALREQVVELIRRNLRGTDVVAHPPGEDLLVLLPGAKREQGNLVANRLCSAIRNHAFAGTSGDRPRVGVTASIGVATTPGHGDDIESLIDAARGAAAIVAAEGGDGSVVAALRKGEKPARELELGRFVGRTDELMSLRRWLDEAIAGSPRAIAVLGEPGSGRAALMRQLESEARLRGGSLVIARARAGGVRSPYGIWTQALIALRRLPDAPTNDWLELTHLDPGIPASTEARGGSKFRLLEEISEYIRLAARSRPLVLVLDEMQWADPESWDVLEHLLTQLERERILIGLTIREDAGQTDITQRRTVLERVDCYHEIRLSRLTRDEVKRWLESAMQRQEIGRELLAFLYRHTEGNPLFIEQLVRCMLDEQSLRHNGERWEWSPVSELQFPTGLEAIISRRFSRLSPRTQAVLQTAAVVGREFDVDLIVEASNGDANGVRAAVEEAVQANFLQPKYERGGGGQAFLHAFITDALLASIPADRAAGVHERVARASEHRPRSASETALHFDLAGRASDAYRCALSAAIHAEGVYAYDTARDFLQIAARNATTPGELAEVRVQLATLAETQGRFDEAEELCDLAIEWFAGQGDRHRALTLRRMRERARKDLGQPARKTLEALLALDKEAAELGSNRERVEILTMLSQTYQRLGDSKAAEGLAEECVEMAESVQDPALLAGALNRLAITVQHESPKRGREYYEKALELYQQIGDVRGQARCHNNLGIVAQLEMRPDYGRESLAMAMTMARAAGMLDLSGTAALNLGVISQKVGDYDRAMELFGEALALFAAVKNSELQLYPLYNMANLERERGDYNSGAQLYEATSSLAQRVGQADVEIGALAGEGLCLLSLGKVDAVKVHLTEIEQRMSNRDGWFQGQELVEALRVRTAIAEGRFEEAMQTFESARIVSEQFDLYGAAWLTAACADVLAPRYPDQVRSAVQKYAGHVGTLGFAYLIRKYEVLQDLHAPAAT